MRLSGDSGVTPVNDTNSAPRRSPARPREVVCQHVASRRLHADGPVGWPKQRSLHAWGSQIVSSRYARSEDVRIESTWTKSDLIHAPAGN